MKRWLKRITPSRQDISGQKYLRVFSRQLQDPNLWHLNRRSVSGACAVGFFVMYLPPVGQMAVAAAFAIVLRVNLPISVALVWLTNPLTMPAMYYGAYRLGSWILGRPATATFDLTFWLEWHNWIEMLAPLTVGSLACGVLGAFLAYFGVQGLWRWHLIRQIRRRRARLARDPGALPPAAGTGRDIQPF